MTPARYMAESTTTTASDTLAEALAPIRAEIDLLDRQMCEVDETLAFWHNRRLSLDAQRSNAQARLLQMWREHQSQQVAQASPVIPTVALTVTVGSYGVWLRTASGGGIHTPRAVHVIAERPNGWLIVAERSGDQHRVKRHNVQTPAQAQRWHGDIARQAEAWAAEAVTPPA